MERKRILIAVNQPSEIVELREALVVSGYETKVVDNGVTALRLCREFRPHLIFAELDLAKIDAHHLLRELKSHATTRSVPFVVMSRHRSVAERVHTIELGADEYITMPFDLQEVILRFEIIFREIDASTSHPKRGTRGFSGKLTDMNLLELLQTLEIGKKSAAVSLQEDELEGSVLVKDGQVVNASLGNLPPEHALFRMFTWSSGTFRVDFVDIYEERAIQKPTSELIARGLSYRERWLNLTRGLPPFNTPIKRPEGEPKGSVSDTEKAVLALVNGDTRLGELMDKTQLDDLTALQILTRLYSRGLIEEAPQNGLVPNGKVRINGKGAPHTPDRLSRLIVEFLAGEKTAETQYNPRRTDGSAQDADKSHHVHLNKSELLMIRAKLASGT